MQKGPPGAEPSGSLCGNGVGGIAEGEEKGDGDGKRCAPVSTSDKGSASGADAGASPEGPVTAANDGVGWRGV